MKDFSKIISEKYIKNLIRFRKKKLSYLLIILIIFSTILNYQSCYKNTLSGYAVVIDGDTIKIGNNKIRLLGIDAPELSQKCSNYKTKSYYLCGLESKKYLEDLIKNKIVKCTKQNYDKFKRILALCHIGNIDLNASIVKSGNAVAYSYYSNRYIKEENIAKNAKLGIWGSDFEQPSIFRRKKLNKKNLS